jgi:hypothetical protein
LSEIGLALKMGRPVVGLHTWEVQQEGTPVEALFQADTAVQAVEMAVTLAASRTPEGGEE